MTLLHILFTKLIIFFNKIKKITFLKCTKKKKNMQQKVESINSYKLLTGKSFMC